MRSPEEVAREIRRLTWDALGNDGLVEEDGPALADLIRARDAEVAEAARAEALAGFGWEYGFRDDRGRNYRLHDQGASVDIPAVFTLTYRLFGPWEQVEP